MAINKPVVMALVVVAVAGQRVLWGDEAPKRQVQRQLIGDVPVSPRPPGTSYADWLQGLPEQLWVSWNLRGVAWMDKKAEGLYAVVNGKRHGPYDRDVEFLRWGGVTSDTVHFAFVATRAGKSFMVVDGVEHRPYSFVVNPLLQFSSDGRRTAYQAGAGSGIVLVVDGVEHDRGEDILEHRFGANGAHLAYAIEKGRRRFAVINDRCSDPYLDAMRLSYIEPAGQWCYQARDGSGEFVVAGGTRQKTYNKVFMVAREDHYYYLGQRGADLYEVVDGRETLLAHAAGMKLGDGGTSGSPVGGHRVWRVPCTPDDLLFVDGQRGPTDATEVPQFTADGKHMWYVAKVGDKFCMVLDGKPSGWYERVDVDSVVFGPGGRSAFMGWRDGQTFCVVDGQEGSGFRGFVRGPAFSPDGKHVSHMVAYDRGKTAVLLDGEVLGEYDGVGGFHRRPGFLDNGALCYVATRSGKQFLVADGVEGEPYDAILQQHDGWQLVGASPDSCRYLGLAGQSLYFVTERIVRGPAASTN
jgi:hypothetical protein